ncbi:MAG: ribbon-helix-helix protein, CopG family [Acidobacteria bacterium]|nr:ribbon-helix-helix protein, CopG family [Acidobacteriota bacterium]
MARYDVFLGVKIPREMAEELRRLARADERSVSAFLRRLLAAALAERSNALAEKRSDVRQY